MSLHFFNFNLNKMSIIATPLQENTTETAHFIIFAQSTFTKQIMPLSIYNIYKDALYIHTFRLHKLRNEDLEYQYAIIVYRRNTAYLSCHKRMFLQSIYSLLHSSRKTISGKLATHSRREKNPSELFPSM